MITTVTMNAALDKAYFMNKVIENGTVMRVQECRTTAGGKGLNVARAAYICGADVQATGLVGGFNGQYLESLLDKDEIPHQFGHVKGETRSCINILDEGYGSTEYLEPGFEVAPEEEQDFMKKFPEIIRDSDVVTISGSIPRGLKKDIYGRMITIAKAMGKTVLLDSSGDTLKNGITAGPNLVKPNQDEIEQIFDTKITSLKEVVVYAKKIHEMGVDNVVISLGKDGALLVCEDGVFKGKPPKVEAVNAVGCGDSMLGAFAVAFERGYTAGRALKYAISVATANAVSPNTGKFEYEQCEDLFDRVTIEKI